MRRQTTTRRGRALRWAAVLALLAALTAYRYDFSPEGAWRSQAEALGTGAVQMLWELESPELEGTENCRVTLLGSDKALLLSATRFTWHSGWAEGAAVAVDCSGPASLHGGWWLVGTPGAAWPGQLCYGYGRVEDPAVVRAEFQIFDQGAGKVLQTISVPKEQWKPIDGKPYFVVTARPEGWEGAVGPLWVELTGYDAAGAVLDRRTVGDISAVTAF